MTSLPKGLTPNKRTATFTETTIPAGILKDHQTKAGVWGLIHVLSGSLRYVIPSLGETKILTPEENGVVIPETPHHVAPMGPFSFNVEFWSDKQESSC